MDQASETTSLVNKARDLLIAVESQQQVGMVTNFILKIEASTGATRQAYVEDLQYQIEQVVGLSNIKSIGQRNHLSNHLVDLMLNAHRPNFDPEAWFENVQDSPSGGILAQILSY